mgnify:CR=1 FL=1
MIPIHQHSVEIVQIISAAIGALLVLWAGFDAIKDYYYQKKWRAQNKDNLRVTRMGVRREVIMILVQLALCYFGVWAIVHEPPGFVMSDRAYVSRYTMTFVSITLVIASAWHRRDPQILFDRARRKVSRCTDRRA